MSPADRAGVLVFAALLALGFAGVALAADLDNDGWGDDHESYMGTSAANACPLGLSNAAWPPDMNNDAVVDVITDLAAISNNFGKVVGPPPLTTSRHDLAPIDNPDGFIDVIGDIVQVANYFGQSCTP